MKRVGIVGCGGIAHVHAQVLEHMEDMELAAFADIRPERAEEFADRLGGNAYASLKETLEKEKLDALHICTPHHLHVPMAIEALEKGLDVVMEKPPAISKEQQAQLREVLEKHPERQLGVSFQNRYNPGTQLVRRFLTEKIYGKVLGARAFVTWKRDVPYYTESGWRGTWKTEGGGVLINQSIHTLDLLRYLLGEPKSVEGRVVNHHLKEVIEVEDTAEAYIEFPDCHALFYATTAYCTDSPVVVEIVCENAVLRIEGDEVTVAENGKKPVKQEFPPLPHVGKNCWGASHQALIGDFYRCLENGTHFGIDFEEACRTLNLMLGIYESNESKVPALL